MIGLLPPIGAKGVFQLKLPFTLNTDHIYICSAHRTLNQMIVNGDDPLNTVYLAAGLTEGDYQTALRTDVVIVTLLSGKLKPVVVPTTHIKNYTNGGFVDHQHVIVTASCGILPVSFDNTRIREAVNTALQEFVGIEPTVYVVMKDTTTKVTEEQALANEQARAAAIEFHSTTYKDKLALVQQNEVLRLENQKLIMMLEQYTTPPDPDPYP